MTILKISSEFPLKCQFFASKKESPGATRCQKQRTLAQKKRELFSISSTNRKSYFFYTVEGIKNLKNTIFLIQTKLNIAMNNKTNTINQPDYSAVEEFFPQLPK